MDTTAGNIEGNVDKQRGPKRCDPPCPGNRPTIAASVFKTLFFAALAVLISGITLCWFWTDIRAWLVIERFCAISGSTDASRQGIFFDEQIDTHNDSASSESIEKYYRQTVSKVNNKTGKQPLLFHFSSASYPRLHAVWQMESFFVVVKVGQGNDNDHVRWMAAGGQYDPTLSDDPYLTPEQDNCPFPISKDRFPPR